MINKYTSGDSNNLNGYESFDTMYMTKEQIEEGKRIAKENGFGKELKKYFVGIAIAVVGLSAVGLTPLIISNPLVSTGIMAAGTGATGIWGMFQFFKLRRKSNEIKDSIAHSNEDVEEKKR